MHDTSSLLLTVHVLELKISLSVIIFTNKPVVLNFSKAVQTLCQHTSQYISLVYVNVVKKQVLSSVHILIKRQSSKYTRNNFKEIVHIHKTQFSKLNQPSDEEKASTFTKISNLNLVTNSFLSEQVTIAAVKAG